MPIIIIDRNKKKANFDNQWNDSLGIEEARKNKANTIAIDSKTDNPVEKFLLEHPISELMGKKVCCKKDDKDIFFTGWVRDIYPSKYLLVRINGRNLPMSFKSVISIWEE